MSEKKKIMIIAHFCDYGEEQSNNRFNYLAKILTDNGFEVELVTSSFSHKDKKQRIKKEGLIEGYKNVLIYEPSYLKNVSLKRLFYSHRKFANNLKRYLSTCKKPDAVYCAIPSVDVAEVASDFSIKEHIPFIIDVQDLWPEAFSLIIKNRYYYELITRPITKRIDRVYSLADRIIAVSETYAKRAMSVNHKCTDPLCVFLGTDLSSFDQGAYGKNSLNKKNELWIAYCGTLGHSYNLNIIFEALNILQLNGITDFRFVVMGSGPLEHKFKNKANEYNIPVLFTGKLPYPEMCAMLKQCDISVNPISKGASLSIINKHADYAMAGLPVVSTQESYEYQALLTKYDCGISCDPNSVEEVVDALGKIMLNHELRYKMGLNARRMAELIFDRKVSYTQIVSALVEVIK